MQLGDILDEPYVITSLFNSPRNYSAFGGKVNDRHEGIDFDVLGGNTNNKSSVLCTYDGIVSAVKTSAGYGKHVIAKHIRNGSVFYTWYAHLDDVYVVENQALLKGDKMGEIGSTGNAYGEHVHFNLQVPNYGLSGYILPNVVNPLPYLN